MLTAKQERFCQEYIVDCNATAAATRAKYSEKTAAAQAYQMMQLPHVKQRIDELKRAQTNRTEITADDVLNRLNQMGGFNIAECFTDKGALKNIRDIPEALQFCIASVEVFEVEEFDPKIRQMVKIGETKKIKFVDKLKSNELIGRHKKMFTDKVDHTHRLGRTLEDIVAAANSEDPPPQISGKDRKKK